MSFDHRLDLNEWTVDDLVPALNSMLHTQRKPCSELSGLFLCSETNRNKLR